MIDHSKLNDEQEYRNYLASCGFDSEEIEQKIEDRKIMNELYSKYPISNREITCSSYERSQKELTKRVNVFLGVKQ